MSVDTIQETRWHKSYDRNIRHINYSLLKTIRFSEEPVVPNIISEGVDEIYGRYFEVEELPGMDLDDLIELDNVLIKDKFQVILHVIRQLQKIDEEGFVLFDRSSSNIRVLKWGEEKVSVRQMDIEDIYDKDADCVHSLEDQEAIEKNVKLFKEKNIDFWTPTVNNLASMGTRIARKDNQHIEIQLSQCKWKPGTKGSNLKSVEKVVSEILTDL